MSARSTPFPNPDRPRFALSERRLHSPQMYKRVFESGRALRSAPLTLRYAQASGDMTRAGFIIRKQVGNACLRNSIRRVLRHCFVEALPNLPEGTWVVFDVPARASQARRSELRAEAVRMLAAVGAGR